MRFLSRSAQKRRHQNIKQPIKQFPPYSALDTPPNQEPITAFDINTEGFNNHLSFLYWWKFEVYTTYSLDVEY